MAPGPWTTVGVPEAGAAVGLIVGLCWAPLGIMAAVGAAVLMVGAIVLHVRVGFLGKALVPPLVVGGFAAPTAVLRLVTAWDDGPLRGCRIDPIPPLGLRRTMRRPRGGIHLPPLHRSRRLPRDHCLDAPAA